MQFKYHLSSTGSQHIFIYFILDVSPNEILNESASAKLKSLCRFGAMIITMVNLIPDGAIFELLVWKQSVKRRIHLPQVSDGRHIF